MGAEAWDGITILQNVVASNIATRLVSIVDSDTVGDIPDANDGDDLEMDELGNRLYLPLITR